MMRTFISATLLAATALTAAAFAGDQSPPSWAYPVAPTPPPAAAQAAPAPVDTEPRHVPNSAVMLTVAQVRDLYNVPDWHPDDHPAAPDVVLRGRKPGVFACGFCHLPNGL